MRQYLFFTLFLANGSFNNYAETTSVYSENVSPQGHSNFHFQLKTKLTHPHLYCVH